jgi:hypothetical protein
MQINKPLTVLILMNATPAWLSLTRKERAAFVEQHVTPIFYKVADSVKVRLYDSEYFNAKVSDYMIVKAGNLQQYKLFIEKLRDTKIYGEPYFTIVDIIPGQENAFQEFDEMFATEQPLNSQA